MKNIVIIGSGPGGYYTALKLSKNPSLNIYLIEKEYTGGTCLNVGCIPTKTLLDHTSLYEHFLDSAKKKIFSTTDAKINIDVLRSFQGEVIKQLKSGLEKLFSKKKINFIQGEASFLSKNKILVKSNSKTQEIDADEIIIATGSKPKTIPGFNSDKKHILSSDDIWNIPNIPQKLLVIGSGPIGIEFARAFHTLGSKVTIAEIQEQICPILDFETSENLVRSLKKRGIVVKPNFASKLIEIKNNSVIIEFLSTQNNEKTTKEEFDQILVAVGRNPNIESLNLQNAQIELEPQGFVKVNEYLQTNIKNIWAIGDITNFPQLAHTASFQARVVADNILGKKRVFKGDIIPSCIFGYPEIAFVGATEQELKEKKLNYKAGKSLFLASGKAKASGLTEGLVKVLMDNNTKKILGAHIIGAEASNLIHEVVIAMQNDLTVDKLANSIHAHPTYSEVLLEALEDCLGEAVHA